MRTIICNSAQSFWDMADNQFLEGQNVHCVFPVSDSLKRYIVSYQQRCNINNISFSKAFVVEPMKTIACQLATYK